MTQASVEKLEQTGPAEKKGDLSATKGAVGKNAKVAFAKRKGRRAISRDHKIVRRKRVKVSKRCTLARKGRVKAETWGRKSQLLSKRGWVPKRKGRANKKNLHRRSRRKHKQVSGRKSSPEGTEKS